MAPVTDLDLFTAPMTHIPAILTVDAVMLTLKDNKLHVALFQREAAPYPGVWALPGGYVHEQEDSNAQGAALRVLREKTGVAAPYLEEFGTFSGRTRDPRGWSLTVVYYALVPASVLSDKVMLYPVDDLPDMAFDHKAIVQAVVERVRNKAGYSSLPVFLCEAPFTIPELHATYEAVLEEPQNMANFRRKLDDLQILEPVPGQMRDTGRSRRAQLYVLTKPFQNKLSIRERGF